MNAANRLSDGDVYVLARAFVGLPWIGMPISPVTELLLTNLDLGWMKCRSCDVCWGRMRWHAVLAVDPNGPPPMAKLRTPEVDTVPELPVAAHLNADQKAQAAEVGLWLDEYVAWASSAANETPLWFHEGAGLWLAALAIGRRLYVHTPGGRRSTPTFISCWWPCPPTTANRRDSIWRATSLARLCRT